MMARFFYDGKFKVKIKYRLDCPVLTVTILHHPVTGGKSEEKILLTFTL
jgi:hypothetical protein